MPGAADLPAFETERMEPDPLNPLGVKGIGESRTIGATPAIPERGRRRPRPPGRDPIDMPLTPERVWRAIRVPGPAKSLGVGLRPTID